MSGKLGSRFVNVKITFRFVFLSKIVGNGLNMPSFENCLIVELNVEKYACVTTPFNNLMCPFDELAICDHSIIGYV